MALSIAVLTPSLRPARAVEMVESIRATADSHVSIVLGMNTSWGAGIEQQVRVGLDTHVAFGPRQQLGPWTNQLAAQALSFDILASFGDDHRPRTQGWDTRIREAFEEVGSGLVYTADGLQDERLPTAPFWSSDIIAALGWYFPPTLMHMYADNFWLELANALGRRTYLPGVLIEHMHPSVGKAPMDDVYVANDAHIEPDRLAFEALMRDGFAQIVERAKGVL